MRGNVFRIYFITLFLLALSFCCYADNGLRESLSLDETWQIVFDRNNEGRRNEWFREGNFPKEKARQIAVPSCWELTEKDYEGVAFYYHRFMVPDN